MKISNQSHKKFITRFTDALSEHSKELTELDQAIGDGDHGLNMDRGFAAVAAIAEDISALPLDQALKKLGMTLVMKVGGASGPLYGSLFMAMGKVAPEKEVDPKALAVMFSEGVEAVKSRGKSEAGEKTMLEVLVPVSDVLNNASENIIAKVRATADEGLEATREMMATKGRASFLGERSIGHIDPGARSSALLIHTACDVIEELK